MTDYNDMSYPELQAAAKARGLSGGGSKDDLIARLTDASESTTVTVDEPQGERAYDERGNVRPADSRWLS